MKILFLTNVPSPYRVIFFNNLAKFCDLTVIYEKDKSDERDQKWKANATEAYTSIFLNGIKTGTDSALCFGVIKYLKHSWDFIVICGISSLTKILAIQWCKQRRIPYCIEGDGAFSKEGVGYKEKLKRYLLKNAQLCFSTGKTHDKYYTDLGVDRKKIVRYPFTSIEEKDILAVPMSRAEKMKLRKKLGMQENTIVLSVGQFIHRKGFDILLEAARGIDREIGIYIVGGEPTDEYMQLKEKYDLQQVHFVGFKSKPELTDYYKAADIFVLPTREDIWGLVINEAMAYGLPIITTRNCAAGIELVQNDLNGYLIESESVEQLIEAVHSISDNDDKLISMGENSLKIIQHYTIENMADLHIKVFEDKKNCLTTNGY